MMKNKTLAVYLALLFGTYGAHRFYLKGWRDLWAWVHVLATSLGLIGLRRAFAIGQDDRLAWALVPLLGASIFAACLSAIVYGLSSEDKWDQTHHADSATKQAGYSLASRTSGLTIFGVIVALLLGATALMSSIAFTGQRFFEYGLKAN